MINGRPEKNTVLVVDDTQTNIDILVDTLSSEYEVSVAMDGKSALEVVETARPNLILLDVQMPGIDGYEVCKRLKSKEKTRDIPVIFVTMLSKDEDESRGFEVGAVDYITKPISPPIVRARVKTHLELRKMQRDVQELLRDTLAGSIGVLTEILSLLNPIAFSRASRIKRYVQNIVKEIKRPDVWQFELTAMLSQIGCVTLPPGTLKKLYRGAVVSEEEQRMYDAHPSTGGKLLAKIPRLENVAKIISKQNEHIAGPFKGVLQDRDPILLGIQILKMVNDFDRKATLGISQKEVFKEMDRQRELYDPALLTILAKTIQGRARNVTKMILVKNLECGMTTDENIFSSTGGIVLAKGTEVTAPILNFLQNYSQNMGIRQPFRVLVSEK